MDNHDATDLRRRLWQGTLNLSFLRLNHLPEVIPDSVREGAYTLDLTGNPLQMRFAKELDNFPNVTTLILDNCGLFESLSMPTLMNLEVLSLNKNDIVDLNPLLAMLANRTPNLVYLSLIGNPGCPRSLLGVSELTEEEYRSHVMEALPYLTHLDSKVLTGSTADDDTYKTQQLLSRHHSSKPDALSHAEPAPLRQSPAKPRRHARDMNRLSRMIDQSPKELRRSMSLSSSSAPVSAAPIPKGQAQLWGLAEESRLEEQDVFESQATSSEKPVRAASNSGHNGEGTASDDDEDPDDDDANFGFDVGLDVDNIWVEGHDETVAASQHWKDENIARRGAHARRWKRATASLECRSFGCFLADMLKAADHRDDGDDNAVWASAVRKWRNLSKDKVAEYLAEAKELEQEYILAMASLNFTAPEPLTAYMHFGLALRGPVCKRFDAGHGPRLAAKMWSLWCSLPDDAKTDFEQLEQQDFFAWTDSQKDHA